MLRNTRNGNLTLHFAIETLPVTLGTTGSFDEYYVKQLYITVIGVAPPAMSRLSSSAFRCRSSVICKEDLYSKELIQLVATRVV